MKLLWYLITGIQNVLKKALGTGRVGGCNKLVCLSQADQSNQ